MKHLWRWIFGLITLGIVAYLLTEVNFAEVWLLLVQANHWYLLLAFLVYGASVFLTTWRIKYFIDPIVKVDYFFLLKNTVMGFFIGTVTPATQMGGDPVKAHYIGKKYGKPRSEIFGAVLADRFYNALVSIVFVILSAFFALTFLPLPTELQYILQGVFLLLIFSVVIFFILRYINTKISIFELFSKLLPFLRKRKVKRKKPKKWKKIFLKHFGNFSKTFKMELTNRRLIIIGISLSIVYWIINIFVPYILFFAFGTHVSFFLVMLSFNVGILIGEFSPTPGGIGLVEAGTFFVYSLAGINTNLALSIALLSRVIYYFYSILLGGLGLVDLERTVGQ